MRRDFSSLSEGNSNNLLALFSLWTRLKTDDGYRHRSLPLFQRAGKLELPFHNTFDPSAPDPWLSQLGVVEYLPHDF
jgi:hypothetical protein